MAVSNHDKEAPAFGWAGVVVVPPVSVAGVTPSTVPGMHPVALAEIYRGRAIAGVDEGVSSGPADRLDGRTGAVLPDNAHLHGSLVFERPTWAPFPKPLAQ